MRKSLKGESFLITYPEVYIDDEIKKQSYANLMVSVWTNEQMRLSNSFKESRKIVNLSKKASLSVYNIHVPAGIKKSLKTVTSQVILQKKSMREADLLKQVENLILGIVEERNLSSKQKNELFYNLYQLNNNNEDNNNNSNTLLNIENANQCDHHNDSLLIFNKESDISNNKKRKGDESKDNDNYSDYSHSKMSEVDYLKSDNGDSKNRNDAPTNLKIPFSSNNNNNNIMNSKTNISYNNKETKDETSYNNKETKDETSYNNIKAHSISFASEVDDEEPHSVMVEIVKKELAEEKFSDKTMTALSTLNINNDDNNNDKKEEAQKKNGEVILNKEKE